MNASDASSDSGGSAAGAKAGTGRYGGTLSITRPSSRDTDDVIYLRVEEKVSGVEFLELRIDAKEMMLALTSLAHRPCALTVRGLRYLGWEREMKHEEVLVPDGPYGERDERARAAVAVHEMDGWEGQISDAQNNHRVTRRTNDGIYYRVLYRRHVPPPDREGA